MSVKEWILKGPGWVTSTKARVTEATNTSQTTRIQMHSISIKTTLVLSLQLLDPTGTHALHRRTEMPSFSSSAECTMETDQVTAEDVACSLSGDKKNHWLGDQF